MPKGISTKKYPSRVCEQCGKGYIPFKYNQKYCSEGCKRLHHFGEHKNTERICPICRKSFSPHRNTALYCSQKCNSEARNLRKGIKISKEYWNQLREFVIERDNYTCQKCGKFLMEIGLTVHHIKPLYKDGVNEPKNLEALCNKCHKLVHSRGCQP